MSGTKVSSSEAVGTEKAGIVPKDSLAGESIQSGGDFAANSSASGYTDAPAHSLTANTTDTSSATTLDAARDRPSRVDASEQTSDALLSDNGNKTSLADDSAASPYSQTPKGKNLTEGGFDSDKGQFKQGLTEEHDPSRQALRDLSAGSGAASVGGTAGHETQITGETKYDALGGDTEA